MQTITQLFELDKSAVMARSTNNTLSTLVERGLYTLQIRYEVLVSNTVIDASKTPVPGRTTDPVPASIQLRGPIGSNPIEDFKQILGKSAYRPTEFYFDLDVAMPQKQG